MIAGRPRVLVVDDDPVSLRFLCLALDHAGCEPSSAADPAAAEALARAHRYDLLLIDRNLGDISGPELLCRLRRLGIRATAIATSADISASEREMLLGAGFVDTLAKPSTIAAVGALAARHAGASRAPADAAGDVEAVTPAVLDDAGALAALGGDATALLALRRLFRDELETLLRESGGLSTEALGARVHRLRASCGFCGTLALAAATAVLQQALATGHGARSELHAFLAACAEARDALARGDSSVAS